MKDNEKLVAMLNQLLADELTAISQYMVHSEIKQMGLENYLANQTAGAAS